MFNPRSAAPPQPLLAAILQTGTRAPRPRGGAQARSVAAAAGPDPHPSGPAASAARRSEGRREGRATTATATAAAGSVCYLNARAARLRPNPGPEEPGRRGSEVARGRPPQGSGNQDRREARGTRELLGRPSQWVAAVCGGGSVSPAPASLPCPLARHRTTAAPIGLRPPPAFGAPCVAARQALFLGSSALAPRGRGGSRPSASAPWLAACLVTKVPHSRAANRHPLPLRGVGTRGGGVGIA